MAALESRNAGRVLAVIVLLLLAPMLMTGGAYFMQALSRISMLQNEAVGARLMQSVLPLLMFPEAVPSSSQFVTIKRLEGQLQEPLNKRFEDYWSMEQAKRNAPIGLVSSLRGAGSAGSYVAEAAARSQLSLDGNPASYFLIDAAVLSLPSFTDNLNELERRFANFGMDSRPDKAKIQELILTLGRAFEAKNRFDISISRSIKVAGNSTSGAKIAAETEALGLTLGQLVPMLSNLERAGPAGAKAELGKAREDLAATKSQAWKVSKLALDELAASLNTQLDVAKSELFFMTLAAFSAAAMGLGFALQMFRKTLIKLDEVDSARIVEQRARNDAERVNNEIANLNRELADKVKELEEAQNEIVKKGRMEQLGQLTATIAHELRNPLGSVRTSAYLINRKAGGKGLGIDEQISRIENGVVRCDNIITQLLDFSRTKQLAASPANLDSWLMGVVTEEASKLPAQIQIDCVLGLDDKLVPFDPARLQRAIVNLLTNSVEAMTGKDVASAAPTGGKPSYPRLWISTFMGDGEVGIRVKDNGPGIAADLIKKIREPLFTTKSFGTGLGIPAIEQIAAQHGGHLDIRSEPGDGAEFTIYLPANAVELRQGEGAERRAAS